jgi:hypothetical protein
VWASFVFGSASVVPVGLLQLIARVHQLTEGACSVQCRLPRSRTYCAALAHCCLPVRLCITLQEVVVVLRMMHIVYGCAVVLLRCRPLLKPCSATFALFVRRCVSWWARGLRMAWGCEEVIQRSNMCVDKSGCGM